MSSRLAVVIINYRSAALAVDCLASLDGQLDPAQDEAIIVDNASGDGSPEEIERAITARRWWSWARVVRSPVNGGFSAGNNVGIKASTSRFCLLLNSDTIVRPGAIASMLKGMEANPDVGLLGPRLEWPDGAPQVNGRRFVSPISELLGAARFGPLTRALRRWAVTEGIASEPDRPDWLSFSCVLIRREVIERIGLMDEGYFMYYEDIEYCRRAKAAGWGCFIRRDAHVVHLKGGTSNVQSAAAERRRRPAYYYAARARYFAAHYGVLGLWAANVLWALGRAIAVARAALGGRASDACPGEWRDNWRRCLSPMTPWSRAS